jgi:Serine/threonine protein phosphatase
MGGHNAGEVASKIAIETVLEEGKKELFTYQKLTGSDIKDILRNIVYTAHEEILNMSKCNPSMSDMGTTLEVVFQDRNHIYYAHVGDSRIYMTYLDDNCEESISRVTTDHSELGAYMESHGVSEAEARKNVPSNVITQAVGITSSPLSPDVGDFNIGKNNWILICSDGLTDMVQDDCYIGKILIHKKLDAKGKVNELIRAAKDMGGKDNISLIIFRRR